MQPLLEQNKRDAAQYETDFTETFESARDQEALDFATKLGADQAPDPAAAAAPADPAPAAAEADDTDEDLGFGRDVSLGIIHAPRSAVRGARNGLQNMIGLAQDLHNFNTKAVLGHDAKIQMPELPEVDKPATETVTGNLIEAVSQFAVGFKGIDKLVKANKFLSGGEAALKSIKGGKTLVNVLKGAAADLAAFDEQDQRLSNLIQEVPALQNPVTEFLAADPEDGFAEGKLKQAIEGLTIGGLGDVIFDGVKLLKKGKSTKELIGNEKSIDEIFEVPEGEKAGVGLTGREFNFLGDPASTDFFLRRQPQGAIRTARKLDAAAGEAAGVQAADAAGAQRPAPRLLDVSTTKHEIDGFASRVIADPQHNDRITLGKISKDAAGWLNGVIAKKRPAGSKAIDVAEFEHVIDAGDLRHAWSRHGEGLEKNPDNIALTPRDLRRIPEIISTPDSIRVHASVKDKPATIVFRKELDDGSSIVVETVRNKKKQLAFKTMYKQKGKAQGSDPIPPAEGPGSLRPNDDTARPSRSPDTDIIEGEGLEINFDQPDRSFQINFARIQGPEDIKALMDEMVNRPDLAPAIDKVRRGVRPNEVTLHAAEDIDGFDSLMTRRTGDAFNAEQIVAARKVYYDTTEKLMDAARRAAAPEASDIDQFNFRKMVAVHHAVQKEFMGVRAEAGRALQAWNIPLAGSGGENARALEQILNEFGGASASKSLAKRLADVGDRLNTSQINAITTKAASARTVDAVTEAWTLGLLTNPTTHVVNLSSNVLTGLVLGIERLASVAAKDSPVTLRESAAYFTAMLEAQKSALKNAAEAFRSGQTGIGISKLDLPRTRATSRDILDPDGKAGVFSKALDYYGAVLSKYAGGALAFGDEYQKTVLYQAQTRALAVREGISLGLDGQALKEHVAKVLADPPPAIRADAVTFANYGTFTKELGSVGQSVQAATAKLPLLRFLLPFVRTPANIFKFTFARTPLAPISQKVRDDIAAGGVRRAQALTRIGVGTSIMAIGADLSQNGTITGAGPSDPDIRAALKRTGWQPYSIKIGDTWYSYARFEPIATVLGMSADLAEILSNYESYDINAQQEADELATAMAIAVGNQAVGKTFLRGFADMVEMLSDPGRYGAGFLQRFAGSFVPAGSAAIERAIDPVTSQVFNMADAIKSRIPGMSGSVIPRRNIWGDEIKTFYPNEKDLAGATAEGILSLFNPVYYSAEKDAPVDRWMLKNGFQIDMPQKVQVFDGVRIDLRQHPKIYDRLVELRGSGLDLSRYGNQSMKEFFQNLATEEDPFGRHIGFFMAIGNNFDDQQNFISQVARDYTAAAREQLLDEFPELSEIIGRERRNAAVLNAVRPPAQKQESVQ